MSLPETQIVTDLRLLTPERFITRWFDESTPYVFGPHRTEYLRWKSHIAGELGVSWLDVVLVGSAAVGCSLSPHKRFKPFSSDSDIDIAVMSPHHFDIAWRWMRRLGADRYRLPQPTQEWVKEHEKRLVYWGSIATDQLLQYLPFGPEWVVKLSKLMAAAPADGRMINVRLYRDHSSLESYLLNSVRRLRSQLGASGTGDLH
ncbi:MAG: hypothetical protein Q8L86_15065 [Vicinamibacterales bacterium]|nr:hypothetical protein [Vicinamibacterales bacterium]